MANSHVRSMKSGFSVNARFANRWEIILAWFLRALLLATMLIHSFQGQFLYALFCLFVIGILILPSVLARTSRVNIPVEIELIALWWVVTDMTLGRLADLYATSLWYDKATHFSNSILLGFLGFLIIYSLHFTGRLKTPAWVTSLFIFVLALGIGALWEILEYVADLAFHRGAQGSPWQAPLDDTMWDLMLDGAGGLLGALLGPIYIRFSRRSCCRIAAFTGLMAGTGSGHSSSDGIAAAYGVKRNPQSKQIAASAGQTENIQ